MKTHSAAGAQILEQMKYGQDKPLYRYALEICRWHLERWDGHGYPDGLMGEEIPISAQIVAIADAQRNPDGAWVWPGTRPSASIIRKIWSS